MTSVFEIFKNTPLTIDFVAGETIFKTYQSANEMYVIQSGEVQILFNDKLINHHGPGEIFGEMALIDSDIRSATAIAKTDCQLVAIDKKRFMYLIKDHPSFALDVMAILAERLRRMNEMLN